ncbi:uncharacterized protein [Anabrus simplex]|uniref:uncharacterized protein n=1 Tax=Anabrus simplex TaxID=316456 RepID=UPI0035A3A8DD
MQRRTKLVSDLGRILAHFSLQELKDDVIPEFKSVTWKKVKEKLMAEKMSLTVKSATMILTSSLTTLGIEELTRKLYDIMLIDVAFHSKQKFWVTCKLIGNPERQIPLKSIERNLTQACRRNDLECIIRVLPRDDLIWLMIIEKRIVKNQGIVLQKPVYAAYYWGERYLFLANHKPLIIKVIAQALDYDNGIILKLRGQSLESLFRMLKNKESQAASLGTFLESRFEPELPKESSNGIDYTTLLTRKQYTKDFFGDDPPQISKLIVTDNEKTWHGIKSVPKMEKAKVETSVVFKSNNVLQMMQGMVHIGAIKLPLPPFITKVTTQAQTTVNAS